MNLGEHELSTRSRIAEGNDVSPSDGWHLETSAAVQLPGLFGPSVTVEMWVTAVHGSVLATASSAMAEQIHVPRARPDELWNCCRLVLRTQGEGHAQQGVLTLVNRLVPEEVVNAWQRKRGFDHIYDRVTGLKALVVSDQRGVPSSQESFQAVRRRIAQDGIEALLDWGLGRTVLLDPIIDPLDLGNAAELDALSVGLSAEAAAGWKGIAAIDARRWLDGGFATCELAELLSPIHSWTESLLTSAANAWPDQAERLELACRLLPEEGLAQAAMRAGWSLGDLATIREAVGDFSEDGDWVAHDWIEAFLPRAIQPAQLADLIRSRIRGDEGRALDSALADTSRSLITVAVGAPHPASSGTSARPDEPGRSEAKQSIRYMASMALQYGKTSGLNDLLDRVVAFDQYKPFQALLVLLQRPAASYVLPAHHWEQRLGWVVRPDEQPLVLLQPQGPVMFMFDVSQVEPGPHARPLPPRLRNPYAMTSIADAEQVLTDLGRVSPVERA